MRSLAYWRKVLAVGLFLTAQAFARIPPPAKVKVQLETYGIAVVKMEFRSGFTLDEMHYIFIRAGDKLCDEMDTVSHELFHAILKTVHSDSIKTQHDFIYESATPWVDLLRDNPELVKYFLQPREPCRSDGH